MPISSVLLKAKAKTRGGTEEKAEPRTALCDGTTRNLAEFRTGPRRPRGRNLKFACPKRPTTPAVPSLSTSRRSTTRLWPASYPVHDRLIRYTLPRLLKIWSRCHRTRELIIWVQYLVHWKGYPRSACMCHVGAFSQPNPLCRPPGRVTLQESRQANALGYKELRDPHGLVP